MTTEQREGSVRFKDESTGEYIVAEPGSLWFSTISMAAQEVYLDGKWQPIWSDE